MKHQLSHGILSCMASFLLLVNGTGCQKVEEKPEIPRLPAVEIGIGEITDKTVEISLKVQNASSAACMIAADSEDAESTPPTAEEIFSNGQLADLEDGKADIIFDVEPETAYKVYAAAENENGYGKVETVSLTTLPVEKMLSFVSATKTSFTYKVDVDASEQFRHCYMEAWYFEYALAQSMETEGDEFDMKIFLWNMLADFGYDAVGDQEITWTAGDMDEMRGNIAALAPGKPYYAICSLYNDTETWHGVPEVVRFEMEKGGKSSANVTVTVEELTAQNTKIVFTPDENTLFFFYNIHPKAMVDEYLAENGEEGMMDYLFEYGWPAANEYTETWQIDPSTAYTVVVYGVDKNGDEMFVSEQIVSPALEPEIKISMVPYEREAEGIHTYDALKVTVEPKNFDGLNADQVYALMQPKAVFEATLGAMGMNIETVKAQPEYLVYCGATPLPEEDAVALAEKGNFTRIYEELEADTEYVYAILIPSGEKMYLEFAYASTDPMPGTEETEPEYTAFLGEWDVTGTSTEDWRTPLTYRMKIEERTANRSFKITGWGQGDIPQKHPFIARYNQEKKQMLIDVPQTLGTETVDGKEYDVVLKGLYLYPWSDYLYSPGDYDGTAFVAKVSQGHFSMIGEIFTIPEGTFEFKTITYLLVDKETGDEYHLLGDEYKNVNFHISKAE